MQRSQILADRMRDTDAAVEATLVELLSPSPWPGAIQWPPRLLSAMRHATLGGGKRLRPFLLTETARLPGAAGPGMLRAAAAAEMVHCYSLAHDDLPAMDDDDLRRGQPTPHRAFDGATAILAGDALQTLAFDVMADAETHSSATVRADLVVGLARAAGLGGMAGGQDLGIDAERVASALAPAEIRAMQAMKTGALLCFAVQAGAIMGAADFATLAALTAYGPALGAAFQIADDILDAEGDEKTVGKRLGKDRGRNKATLVYALGLPGARQACAESCKAACLALQAASFARPAEMLEEAANFVVARQA